MSAAAFPAISTRMEAADWALLLLLSLIWGGSFFLIGVIVGHLPVISIVAIRVAVAALVLWSVVIITGRPIPRGADLWGAFLVMGVLNNAIPFGLIVWAQTSIPAGLASILNATTPLFTVLVSTLVLSDERANLTRLAGVATGLGGVAVMIGLDSMSGGHGLLPQVAMLGAAISYACAAAFGRQFRRRGIDPVVTAAGMVTGSSVVLLPLALSVDGLPSMDVPGRVWLAVLVLGAVCTGLAYVMFFRILGRAGATNISLVTFLVPVSAILLGWLFLGESLGAVQLLGMAVIGLGLAMIDGRLIRRTAPPA